MNGYEEIIAVPLPETTRSYVPVSNKDLVTAVKMQVELADLEVTEERYELGAEGKQMFGAIVVEPKKLIKPKPEGIDFSASSGSVYGLTAGFRDDMKRVIGVRNSYDKSLPIGFVAGSNVTVCSNLIFEGEIKMLRKHTANVYQDLDNLVFDAVYGLELEFNKIIKNVEQFEQVKLTTREAAELCGRMYIEEQIITSTQLNVIKTEWNTIIKSVTEESGVPPDFQTGWNFMNHCTHALKKAPPRNRMESQLNVNDFLKRELIMN